MNYGSKSRKTKRKKIIRMENERKTNISNIDKIDKVIFYAYNFC